MNDIGKLFELKTDDEGNTVVSGRELFKVLNLNSNYTTWMNRMIAYGFEENIDYITVAQKRATAQGNETEYIEHILKLDMAKEISMIQRSDLIIINHYTTVLSI